MPLKAGEVQPGGAQPLLPGLHVLPAYTRLKNGSSKVSVVVRNMSDSPIFLKKGVQIAHMVSVVPVLWLNRHQRWKLPWELRNSQSLCMFLCDKKSS